MFALIRKIIAAILNLHPVTVPHETDIGRMPIHPRRSQSERLIDRHALRFVECRGIAVVNIGLVFEVERYVPTRRRRERTYVPATRFRRCQASRS